jgi:hypothetical protein
VEHDEQAEELEREADKLDQHSDKVGEHIEETRRDWEAKEDDPSVPGAQPEPGKEDDVTETPEQSDQLPEEAPPGHAPDDTGGGSESDESPGVPGEEETGTGNPDAAGAEEEDQGTA